MYISFPQTQQIAKYAPAIFSFCIAGEAMVYVRHELCKYEKGVVGPHRGTVAAMKTSPVSIVSKLENKTKY
jgi:hypothetical protein